MISSEKPDSSPAYTPDPASDPTFFGTFNDACWFGQLPETPPCYKPNSHSREELGQSETGFVLLLSQICPPNVSLQLI